MNRLPDNKLNTINELEPSPEWFDLTAQQIRDALPDSSSKAKVTQLVDEIRVLHQSTEDLLVHAWTRGKNVARDYRGDVLEVCPYGNGTEPILYTAEQMRASNEASWFAGRDQGTKYGMTFEDFANPTYTEEEQDDAYGVNPYSHLAAHEVAETTVDELTNLEDDWCGPNTFAPAADVLDRLNDAISRVKTLPEGLGIGPDPYGGVILEWQIDDVSHTLILHSDGRAHVTYDHIDTHELNEHDLQDKSELVDILETNTI